MEEEGEELPLAEEVCAEDSPPMMPETISETETQPAQRSIAMIKRAETVVLKAFFIKLTPIPEDSDYIISTIFPFV